MPRARFILRTRQIPCCAASVRNAAARLDSAQEAAHTNYMQNRTWQHAKPDRMASHPPETSMNLHLTIGPLLSLIAGILIFIVPRLLNYIVAIYLIVMGLIGLFGTGALH